MSTRRQIDWERIEAQWRGGTMSTREIAKAHGLSHTAVNRRARDNGWVRDLREKINARAEAKLSQATVAAALGDASSVSSVSTAKARYAEQLTVEVESEVRARVKLAHRSDIRRARELGQRLFAELEAQSVDPALLAQFGEYMRSPNDQGADRLNDLYQKVISLPSRADTAKKLVEVLRLSVALERETYAMDAPGAEPASQSPLAEWFKAMHGAPLPVVREVPRDEE